MPNERNAGRKSPFGTKTEVIHIRIPSNKKEEIKKEFYKSLEKYKT